jgi:hypothetical protein
MFSWGNWTKYKTPEEREKERQIKKHKETCAKNRKARKKKKRK